jgi:hypothetical protein
VRAPGRPAEHGRMIVVSRGLGSSTAFTVHHTVQHTVQHTILHCELSLKSGYEEWVQIQILIPPLEPPWVQASLLRAGPGEPSAAARVPAAVTAASDGLRPDAWPLTRQRHGRGARGPRAPAPDRRALRAGADRCVKRLSIHGTRRAGFRRPFPAELYAFRTHTCRRR